MKDLAYLSACDLAAALRDKKISAVELLSETIARLDKLNPTYNAVVVKDYDRAFKAAKAADEAIAKGERKPLLGVPMTVKESFSVQGLTTTWGNVQFKDWMPQADSLVVSRLKKAGAIIIGKTNVPYMLKDWQSYNEIYGTTNNPWNTQCTPGGSSGGAVAALAAGLVSLEAGSDMGGSLRIPAHFCGVFTHKPSLNLVPLRGAGPPGVPASFFSSDLVVAGPIARTAADLSLGLDVLAGVDEFKDGKGYKLTLPPARHTRLQDFRVLVISEHPLCPAATAITNLLNTFSEKLAKANVSVTQAQKHMLPLTDITLNYLLCFAANLGEDVPQEQFNSMQAKAMQETCDANSDFMDHVVKGLTVSHRDWLSAQRKREQLYQNWRELYKTYDVVICPVSPTVAFPHDHSLYKDRKLNIDGKLIPYNRQFAWISIATLFSLPATVMPIGLTADNLPVGVQIIGDYLEDNTTLAFARLVEEAMEGFVRPKGI